MLLGGFSKQWSLKLLIDVVLFLLYWSLKTVDVFIKVEFFDAIPEGLKGRPACVLPNFPLSSWVSNLFLWPIVSSHTSLAFRRMSSYFSFSSSTTGYSTSYCPLFYSSNWSFRSSFLTLSASFSSFETLHLALNPVSIRFYWSAFFMERYLCLRFPFNPSMRRLSIITIFLIFRSRGVSVVKLGDWFTSRSQGLY